MAEPLEINISKSFVEHGGKQWATYENGGGVTVQVWKNQQLELQRDLSYTDYATFREKAPELGLRDYPAPLMRRQGGTNANGNTLGRVVGETAPTAVPATQANAAIEAETQEESITGEHVLDGLQLGLDVVGLIPVVGEAADIISAGISLARGDYVGAELSLLSAIPFVGYAGTAGKATRYGAKMAEASGKVAREITQMPPIKKITSKNQEPPKDVKDGGKSKGGPCDHLRKGSGKGPYRGGAHNQTSKPVNDNKDSHHMPADDASPLPKRDGPAIQMHPNDHKLTKSNGSVKGSAKYRQSIQELIEMGEWRKAMIKEIKDVRRIQKIIGEPNKYNEAILEMLKYFRCLEKNNLTS